MGVGTVVCEEGLWGHSGGRCRQDDKMVQEGRAMEEQARETSGQRTADDTTRLENWRGGVASQGLA